MNETDLTKRPLLEPSAAALDTTAAPAAPTLFPNIHGGLLQRKIQRRALQRRADQADPAGQADQLHRAADAGIAGAGSALPFQQTIQAAFGAHDIGAVQAHGDAQARAASDALGAQAYAKGEHVAFAAAPDLHTAAHEAAHVVQQRGQVQLKGGVGQEGDPYEQHADAVADTVVAGGSAEALLSSIAGPPGGAHTGAAVQRIGKPLDTPLDPTDQQPAEGAGTGDRRTFQVDQYIEMWEKEQGHKLTDKEKKTLARGCIGISALNLNGGGNPPLDNAYNTFEEAQAAVTKMNAATDWWRSLPGIGGMFSNKRAALFAQLFWSNQSADPKKRQQPDKDAFKPDPKTGKVDMSDYHYRARTPDPADPDAPDGYVNFDYGFWDESSKCFWHANHSQPGMKVYQSTKEKFIAGYTDFDRIVFCAAIAENYDPALAALAMAGKKS